MTARWAVFASGRGSTAQSFFDLADEHKICLVASNKANAMVLKRAARVGVPTWFFDSEQTWDQMQIVLERHRITHIFLLGFMKLIPADFVGKWSGKIWNIHPSLLPLHPGLKSIEKSFAQKTGQGVTIHDVIAKMDAGTVRLQAKTSANEFSQFQLKTAITEQTLIRRFVDHASMIGRSP